MKSNFVNISLVLVLFCALALVSSGSYNAEVVYEFTTVDYLWTSDSAKQTAIDNLEYIQSNNIITGVKVYNNDRVFVTVPRWFQGVPSTLNEIVEVAGIPFLQPYPSWDMQEIGDCSALQYVQSMEIDPYGQMWIVDVGRINILEIDSDSNYTADNSCPPKLVVWDIESNSEVFRHVFPTTVAAYDNSFLNDIAVDPINQIAYISDLLGDLPGGIVIYDGRDDTSYRWEDASMLIDTDGSPARTVNINSYAMASDSGEDGIALTPDMKYVYYCAMASYKLYRITTEYLLKPGEYGNDPPIEYLGERASQMDGMTFSNDSRLFYGAFEPVAVYSVHADETNVTTAEEMLVSDNVTIQWTDTFAWDNIGNVWWTTNRLHRFFMGNMNWTGGEGSNMRIFKMAVGASSYMMPSYLSHQNTRHHKDDGLPPWLWWSLISILFIGTFIVVCFICVYYGMRRRRASTFKEPLTERTETPSEQQFIALDGAETIEQPKV